MTQKILFSTALFFLGSFLVWYQANSQFVWKWWEGKGVLSVLIFAIPTSFCFYYAWTFAVHEFNSLWSARLFSFALSYFVFPVLTWFHLDESPFKTKTIICIVLSLVIILVQVLM
jgi:drug/metabolite transporter (DMT)-like permease|tara:strand:+ start:85 stop:429 length:345 start_codon:yes stop_codon:yes gene_type:complete